MYRVARQKRINEVQRARRTDFLLMTHVAETTIVTIFMRMRILEKNPVYFYLNIFTKTFHPISPVEMVTF